YPGGEGVVLVVGERLRGAGGHGAANVVEDRRGIGPVAADGFDGIVRIEGVHAADQPRRVVGAFAVRAVPGGPVFIIDHLARPGGGAAVGQAGAVRVDVDIPAADFFFRGFLTEAEALIIIPKHW